MYYVVCCVVCKVKISYDIVVFLLDYDIVFVVDSWFEDVLIIWIKGDLILVIVGVKYCLIG